MNLILFVLHDAERLEEVLNAWEEAGAQGVTLFASVGMRGVHEGKALREDIPLMPSLEDFLTSDQTLSRTLLTIVKDDALVGKILEATQRVVGDLNEPATGILAVLPVSQAYGLDRI